MLPWMSRGYGRLDVPAAWTEECRRWKERQGLTLEQLGQELGRAIGQPAFKRSVLSRYLRHEYTSEELTRAFAILMRVPSPRPAVEKPELREWLELGARLLAASPARFGEEVEQIRTLVLALEARKRR